MEASGSARQPPPFLAAAGGGCGSAVWGGVLWLPSSPPPASRHGQPKDCSQAQRVPATILPARLDHAPEAAVATFPCTRDRPPQGQSAVLAVAVAHGYGALICLSTPAERLWGRGKVGYSVCPHLCRAGTHPILSKRSETRAHGYGQLPSRPGSSCLLEMENRV